MSIFRRTEVAQIQAVRDDEFENFLKNLDVLEEVRAGKKKCKFCTDVATVDSISYVLPESGSIKFVCDKPECTSSLLDYINKGKSV